MISDAQLYSLAVFLGSVAMLLTVLYHWLEVNKKDDGAEEVGVKEKSGVASTAGGIKKEKSGR